MLIKTEKKAFIFYASTLEILQQLPDERQGKIAIALIEYGLSDYDYFAEYSDSISIFNPLERMIFRSVLYEINIQKRRHYNKYLISEAIKIVKNTTITTKDHTDNKRNDNKDMIELLEEKYQHAIEHDDCNILYELLTMLPYTIFDKLLEHCKIMDWKNDIEKVFEKRLRESKASISDNIEEQILSELMEDFLSSGDAFKRYDELLKKYGRGDIVYGLCEIEPE